MHETFGFPGPRAEACYYHMVITVLVDLATPYPHESQVRISAMDRNCDHCTWNNSSCHQAPQSQDPEASMIISLVGRLDCDGRNETPFQRGRNSCHHAKSARKPVFRWTSALSQRGRCVVWRRSIILLRKTTLT